MKRLLVIPLALLLVIGMSACDFLFAQPQILLDGEEIETLSMSVGQKVTLSSNLAEDVTWNSSDAKVATITPSGALFAVKEGTVIVTLTVSGKTDSITITVASVPTAWTIGDSIFDGWDNGPNDPVPSILQEAGYANSYTNYCMDNISGSTIYSGKGDGNSILEHMQTGMYEDLYNACGAPDLILIFRGTNDVWETISNPEIFTKYALEQAVHSVCQYFSTNYPDARIVWATPIWRIRIDESIMNEFRQMLHTVCPQYGVDVFDLHLEEPFVSINDENYADVLPDGIHPTFVASIQMKDAFVNYLKNK